MSNKELQEQRMRSYFIQATKDIIKGEGVKALSVRNVAERAGYSYATLYNYFKHINELVFHCVNDFQEEIREYVGQRRKKTDNSIESIKKSIELFVQFFIEYPGIFQLYYLNEVKDIGHNSSTTSLIYFSLDDVCEIEFLDLVNENIYDADHLEEIKRLINSAITGALLFYLNRNNPQSYKKFKSIIKSHLELIFTK